MVVSNTGWFVVGKAVLGDVCSVVRSDAWLTSWDDGSGSNRIRYFAGLLLADDDMEAGEASRD